jgi:hypothetical protein
MKTNIGHVLLQANPYDLSFLSHEVNPDRTTIANIFGQIIAKKYDEERMGEIIHAEEVKNALKQQKTV